MRWKPSGLPNDGCIPIKSPHPAKIQYQYASGLYVAAVAIDNAMYIKHFSDIKKAKDWVNWEIKNRGSFSRKS